MPDIRFAYNGKFVSPSSAKVIGDRALPPIAQRTLRFKFYDKTIDPRQWEDVWNLGATWTKVKQGIYDWHYDSTEWAAKYSGAGASSGGNSALASYRHKVNGNWTGYLTNVDLDIIDSDLTGVTTVYQLFNAANGVHHCSLKNTASVQNWSQCFANGNRYVKLESLDPLDMSSVDVTKFSGSTYAMFNGARYLNSPIVLNLPNAVSLKYLFYGQYNKSSSTLTLNLSSAFTGATASVLGTAEFWEVIITGTTGMTSARYFSSSNVNKYTWTDWNTAGVDCTSMFTGGTNLTEISLPVNAKVTNANSMFYNCRKIKSIPSLDLSSCTNTNRMFSGCTALTSAPSYNLPAVTDSGEMFSGCSALTSAPSLTFRDLTTAYRMFQGCSALTSVPAYDLAGCTNTFYMFGNCTSLVTAPSIDLSGVTNVNGMFGGCTSLTSVPSYVLTAATNTSYMFSNCTSLTSAPSVTLPAATDTSYMFSGCTSLTSVPSYVLTSATNTSNMFYGCTSLSSVPSVTLPAATDTSSMFSGCTAIASGALTMYNYLSTKPVAVTTYNDTFTNCGSGTVTGNADLDQIPIEWGGHYRASGTITCTIDGARLSWICSQTMPYWTSTGPEIDITTSTAPVPSEYEGIGIQRDRINYPQNSLDLTNTADLYVRPAFYQRSSTTQTPFSWILTTSTELGHLPGGTLKVDMPKMFSDSDVGSTDVHYGSYDSSKTVYFGFVATNASPSNWQGLTDAYGLLYNSGFGNFVIDWELTNP